MRQVYRVAGADLDLASLKVNLTPQPIRAAAPARGAADLPGGARARDPRRPEHLQPAGPALSPAPRSQRRAHDPGVLHRLPDAAALRRSGQLLATERNDSLYRTPGYLLFTEGPPAKFVFRLRYNASSSGDRSTLDLGALQIRDGSEALFLNGRRLEGDSTTPSTTISARSPSSIRRGCSATAAATIQARFEERGIFAVAPTQIYGLSTRYSLGETGGINLLGIYQVEQSAFNRPQLGLRGPGPPGGRRQHRPPLPAPGRDPLHQPSDLHPGHRAVAARSQRRAGPHPARSEPLRAGLPGGVRGRSGRAALAAGEPLAIRQPAAVRRRRG